MRGDDDHLESVDLLELERLSVRGTGHAGEVVVEAEIVLERDRRDRLVLVLDRDTFLGLDGLVQAVGPTPSRHRAAGELVHDHDLAVLDDVLHVALVDGVCAERGVQVMQQANVARVVEALAFLEQPGTGHQAFDLVLPFLGEVRLLPLEVGRVIPARREPAFCNLVVVVHEYDVGLAGLADADRLFDRHDLFAAGLHRLALLVDERDLARDDVEIGVLFRLDVLHEFRNQLVDLRVKVGAGLGRSRDDERRAGLVDQDGVDLVHDREIQVALHLVGQREREVVAQVVEAELVIGRVRDVAGVRGLFFLVALAGFRHPDGQAEKLVSGSHPVRVALCQVLVHGDHVHTLAAQRVQVGRQRRHQRLAFTGAHFRDVAVVQHHAADELHVERPHAERAARRLAHHGEGLGQQLVQRFAVGHAPLQFLGPGAQARVVERLDALFQRIDLLYGLSVLPQQPLVTAAEDTGQKTGQLVLLQGFGLTGPYARASGPALGKAGILSVRKAN